jgi:hypothetical protein
MSGLRGHPLPDHACLVLKSDLTRLWDTLAAISAGGLEYNLAKVGVEGSNPFARSDKINSLANLQIR